MKNHVKELTEGMQRLCAVANRVVQSASPHRIDVDLLLENLRSLYEVALQMESENSIPPGPSQDAEGRTASNDMAMMLTIAAMQSEQGMENGERETENGEPNATEVSERAINGELELVPEPEPALQPKPTPEPTPEPDPMPPMEELEQSDNALLFDEVIIETEEIHTSDPSKDREGCGKQEVSTPLSILGGVGDEAAVGEAASGEAAGQVSLLDYLGQPAQRTLGESLVADRPQTTSLERKVDDLRAVININDKFSFMSELFHNNMKAYNDFIMSLNAMTSRDEAMAFVQNVATQQKWDDASATVQEFYKVFDKKF